MKELSDCRVLIVDDAKANLDILVEGLKTDHKLSLALNGEMALQIATRTPPDLVLLDIVMPGLDGYEVCRRMRQMPETAEVPIMFLSSLEEVQNKTRGFELGANDYLTKPFELLEVKARVRSLLKAKAYADAVKEKIAYDLRIAREIQMGILPTDVAAVTEGTGLEANAILHPAQAVGGDLYEVLRTPDGNLVARLKLHRLSGGRQSGHEARWQARLQRQEFSFPLPNPQWRRMPRAGVVEPSGPHLVNRAEDRHKHVARILRGQRVADPTEDFRGRPRIWRHGAHQGRGDCHEQRGGNSFAGNVAHDRDQVSVRRP